MSPEIIVPIAFVAAIAFILTQLFRLFRIMMAHRTVREALTRDATLAPALLERIEVEQKAGGLGDGRIGLVLLALGAALIGFGLIQGDPDDIRNLSAMALFPLFIGAVLLARVWYLRRQERDAG